MNLINSLKVQAKYDHLYLTLLINYIIIPTFRHLNRTIYVEISQKIQLSDIYSCICHKKAVPLHPILKSRTKLRDQTAQQTRRNITNNVIQTATYRKQTGIHIPLLHSRYDSNESLLPMYGYVTPITHTITQSYIPVGNRLRGFFMSPPMCSGREHTIIYTKKIKQLWEFISLSV